jgi:hypothetical protein
MASGDVISFGPYRLIPAQRLLLRGEEAVDVGSRALDILIALTEAAGELVGQRQLMARAWPNVVVGEGSRVSLFGATRMRDSKAACIIASWSGDGTFRAGLGAPSKAANKIADRDGMYVRVMPSGAISFRLDYRLNGRRETVYLGRYGRDGISLALAREKCLDAKRAIGEG